MERSDEEGKKLGELVKKVQYPPQEGQVFGGHLKKDEVCNESTDN